uniref:Sodium/calcium exchanger membrane region domain-containing protein n=1 Tax=Tetraselmis sp. GSL018 TaxID=582737 RepID=A0A061QL45_9CHLO
MGLRARCKQLRRRLRYSLVTLRWKRMKMRKMMERVKMWRTCPRPRSQGRQLYSSRPVLPLLRRLPTRQSMDPFIVAFVVTPLASNASEVVSSFLFALKKRKSNISLCYSQVYGAITMNNTLCLGLFLAIVHLRGLVWDFSAEVTAMVSVILLVGALGSSRNTFQLAWALPVALLYPISLAGVEFLENVVGWQ